MLYTIDSDKVKIIKYKNYKKSKQFVAKIP